MSFNLNNIKTKQRPKSSKEFDVNALLKKEIHLFGKKFSNKKKEAFYTEISVLLNAGMPLKETLDLLANQYTKKIDKDLINGVIKNIIDGHSFSDSLKNKNEFTDYEFYSIKIGEETGTLKEVTQELGFFFARKNEQKRNVISAITYPIVIFITAILAVTFMLKYVVPMFADIFKQNKVELPWITKLLIKLSGILQNYTWLFVLIIISLFVIRKFISNKEWYQKYASKLVLSLPFIGELYRKVYFAQFTQAIALLSKAKVPLQNSIKLVTKMIPFYPLQKALKKIETDLIAGNSLSNSMQKHKIFDTKMVSLLKVAEETNQTEYIFTRLAKQYNDEVQYQSKQLSTLIEPFIIIFLGIVVGTILVAMYLPMFRLSNVLG